MSVENVTKNSAVLKVSVVSFMDDPLHPGRPVNILITSILVNGDISECSLNIVVVDASGMTVLDKLLTFNELSGIVRTPKQQGIVLIAFLLVN